MIDIVSWAGSRYGFYVDRRYDAEAGRWILEKGPIKLADYHKRILRHVFTPGDDGKLPYDVCAWAEPAKSGKSAIAGLVGEYAALHLDGDVIMASNKRTQAASLMFRSLTDSIEMNPHLPNVEPNKYEVEFANGNTVRAIPSNSRGESGARFAASVFDELWGYVYQDAERLWDSFKTDPTRLASMRLAVGYGGYDDSVLWKELLERGLKGEPVEELADIDDGRGAPSCWRNGRHFTFWSHVCRQPWQTEEWRRSQRQSLRPAEYSRMIDVDFAAGVGNFIDPELWEALVDPEHKPLEPHSPHRVYIGVDIALAAGGDDAVVIGLYADGPKVKVAFHRIWRGGRHRTEDLRISQTVRPALLEAAKRCSVGMIAADPWQGRLLLEELDQAGLPAMAVLQNHSRAEFDMMLWQLARNGDLVLYDAPDLVGAAAHTTAKELADGRPFIIKTHIRSRVDLMVAMSNALAGMLAPVTTYTIMELPRVPIDTRY